MFNLSGKISDRIRNGNIPAESLTKVRVETAEEMPTPDQVRRASGRGLGSGATRARNGEGR